VAIGTGIFWACEKENVDNSLIKQKSFNSNGLMYFSNQEEFANTMDMLLAMDFDELCAYEDSLGYTSYGRECEELYYNSIEGEDSLTSDEEIENFVSEHSNFLNTTTDFDGEELYVPILFDHPFRYVLNENKMFQIGDMIFKVYNSGIVSTNYQNLSALINLQENELSSIEPTSVFSYAPASEPYIYPNNIQKDAAHNLGGFLISASVNSSNTERVRIKIERLAYYGTDYEIGYYLDLYGFVEIRGFRKIGKWWCNGTRHISHEINVTTHYFGWGIYNSTPYYSPASTTSRAVSKVNYNFMHVFLVNYNQNSSFDYLFHFASANGYASIPAVTTNFNFQ